MPKPQPWIALLVLLPALAACQQPPKVTAPPPVPTNPPPVAQTEAAAAPTEAAPTDEGEPAEVTPGGPTPTSLYASDTLDGFDTLLTYGIDTRNYQYLLYAMTDPFVLLDEKGSGGPMQARDAVEKFKTDLLPNNLPAHYDMQKDVKPLLGGKAPEEYFGPDAHVVSAFYSDGWGKDGKGAAVLFISQSRAGVYGWYAVMFAPEGFK